MTPLTTMKMHQGDVVRDPKPKKRKGKSARQKTEEYTDSWCRELVKLRDKKCVTCGARGFKDEDGHWWAARDDGRVVLLDWSHLFSRGRDATRWVMDATYAQCRICHALHHRQDQHPLRSYAYKRLGQERMDELYLLSRTTPKFSLDYIKNLGDAFRDRCRELS